MSTQPFQNFDAETYFARRLYEHGVPFIPGIYAGRTNQRERQERIRAAIVECGLANEHFGKRLNGTRETFQEAYERFYGTSLLPTQGDITNAAN